VVEGDELPLSEEDDAGLSELLPDSADFAVPFELPFA
jgi:hypothetical protein